MSITTVLKRYQNNEEIRQHWVDSFRTLVGQITFIETAIAQHNQAKKEPKSDMFNRLYQSKNRKKTPSIDGVEVTPEMRMSKSELEQSKMNQRLIVNVLDKIIVLGN